jgi:hypothetical protein
MNATMIHGCKEYFDNLPASHDEVLCQGLIAEKALLLEDDRVSLDTEARNHDNDTFGSNSID